MKNITSTNITYKELVLDKYLMEKTCKLCNEVKPVDQFSKNHAVCKSCRAYQASQLRKVSKATSVSEVDNNPNMIFIMKKISAMNERMIKSIPTLEELTEYILDITEAHNQLNNKEILFYFPIDVSDTTKQYLRPALKHGLTVSEFRNCILLNNTQVIVDKLKLDMHGCYGCLKDLTSLHDYISAIRMGYYCIDKYTKDSVKNGSNGRSEELFVNTTYDPDIASIVVKQNPMHLTVAQFIQEIRKIIQEYDEVLVSQFEKMGLYAKLLAIGRNSITETSV